jgi:N-dimethylarginine dimethylaminohydrolase
MVSVYQCFDPLKVCVVGRSYPPEFYSEIENVKVRSAMERVAIETEEDYQKLISKLEEFGVEVIRLDVSDNIDDYKDFNGVMNAAPPMCPRDFTAMVGNTFYMPSKNFGKNFDVDALYLGMLNKNLSGDTVQRGREKVLAKYFEDLIQPGRPLSQEAALESFRGRKNMVQQPWKFLMGIDREELEKVIIASETSTIGSNKKFPSNKRVYAWNSVVDWLEKNNVPIVYDQYINSAGCWRLGKDLFFNYTNIISKLNEESFHKKWRKLFPDHRVHGVDVPGHGDGAMHPVKEGLIISVQKEEFYKDFYPDWEVVKVENSRRMMKPFLKMKHMNSGRWWIEGEENNQDLIDYIHTWLDHWVTYAEETVFDINVLPIDEQNCIVNGYNKTIFDAFDRHGVTPHIVNFRHRWFWDGGLHCITSDIHREGTMKTYW